MFPDPPLPALPVLTGPRLRLRPFRHEDVDDLYAVHSDPRVMRYWSTPTWTDIDQARRRLRDAMEGNDPEQRLCWAIAMREADRLIGGVTLFAINRAQGRAEVGYSLGSPHWGHGYAAEAMRLAIAHAFGALGLRRLEADIDPRNTASWRLAERLGFQREGLLRERWCVGGELCDTWLYGLLARESPG